jgi:glycogen debranching enzyme
VPGLAAGFALTGSRDPVRRGAAEDLALIEAAGHSRNRLPEAFAGFPRDIGRFPVPYPTACSPQAWATVFVSAMLGLDVSTGALEVHPDIPDSIGRIKLRGLRAFGHRWDVEAVGRSGYVRLVEGD